MEFSKILSRTGGRALYRSRSILLSPKSTRGSYHPEIILAGRRMNDSMGKYVADQVIKLMIARNISIHKAHILVLGITFKENCPDVRNTKVTDVVRQLESFHTQVTVYDPWANPKEVWEEHQIHSVTTLPIENMMLLYWLLLIRNSLTSLGRN